MDWLLEDPDRCLWLADLLVATHFAVVAFALGGAIAILIGGLRRWEWVRGLCITAMNCDLRRNWSAGTLLDHPRSSADNHTYCWIARVCSHFRYHTLSDCLTSMR